MSAVMKYVDDNVLDAYSSLPSALPDVSDGAWAEFVRRMARASLDAVSEANALGMFELQVRRLADLGYVDSKSVARRQSRRGRTIWVARFIAPMTCAKFLRSPQAQYRAFCRSMIDYATKMSDGVIVRPARMQLAAPLAILHRAGPHGLVSWSRGDRRPETEALVKRVEELF